MPTQAAIIVTFDIWCKIISLKKFIQFSLNIRPALGLLCVNSLYVIIRSFSILPKKWTYDLHLMQLTYYLCVKKILWLVKKPTTFKKAINLCRQNSSSMYSLQGRSIFSPSNLQFQLEPRFSTGRAPPMLEVVYIYIY